jgi:aminoglycoside phosphotransferase (APT) family kinase protein
MIAPPPDRRPGVPPAEVDISDDLVRGLLRRQHPDLADLPIRLHGSGWDNTTYRLGSGLAVRLPRRLLAVDLIRNEQRWLPQLARRLPVPISVPVRVGVPDLGYPWPWNVVSWVDGVPADEMPLAATEAGRVGAFLRALHQPGPPEAPRNAFRGGRLADREETMALRLPRLDSARLGVPPAQVRHSWEAAKQVPVDRPAVWLHGDIHPRNVLVAGGELAAVVDWGDLCVGDPATDLAAAWMLFDNEAHGDLATAYGPMSAQTWERARGWALLFGVLLVDSGSDDDAWADTGRLVLRRVLS